MATLNDILFPVSKVENPATTNSEYAWIVQGEIIPKGETDPVIMDLNYCSDRYELVPNDTIFPRIEADLQARGYKFTVEYEMIDHVRFYGKYILEDSNLVIGSGNDMIKPIINVSHSYNGLTKYKINFGYFRLICSNGLTIPVEGTEDKNLSIVGKHTREILNSLDQLWSKLDYFFSIQDTIKERFDLLTSRTVSNVAERVEKILEATNLKPSKVQLDVIYVTINNEANLLYNGVVNDWLIYNGINAYLYKGVDSKGNLSKAVPEKKAEMDAKVLAEIMKVSE